MVKNIQSTFYKGKKRKTFYGNNFTVTEGTQNFSDIKKQRLGAKKKKKTFALKKNKRTKIHKKRGKESSDSDERKRMEPPIKSNKNVSNDGIERNQASQAQCLDKF